MASDIASRLAIRNLKAQLGKSPVFQVIGRRITDQLEPHVTDIVSTWDTTYTYRPGVSGFDVVGLTSPQLYVGHDPSSQTRVRVANQNDEFWLLGNSLFTAFIESSLTTASVVSSTETISFSLGDVLQTKAIFLNCSTTYSQVTVTPTYDSSFENPDVTYYVSPDASTWQEVTASTQTTLTAPTDTLYFKVVANSATSLVFEDSNGSLVPLRVKLSA